MPVVPHADKRVTSTPNAVMTTHASPTQGAARLAVWTVEMEPAASGPLHTMDHEQVWTVLRGTATVDVDGRPHELAEGDTLVLPAAVRRQIRAGTGFRAVVAAPAGGLATAEGADPVLPPWIA